MQARQWQRASVLAWLLLLAGLILFLSLGRWQLARAQEKERLLASYALSESVQTRDLASLPAALPADLYPRVHVTGRYVAQRGYWLDDQVRHGRVGRFAIAVFQPNSSATQLLVNRGWIASQPGTPPPPWPVLPGNEIELRGIYAPPPGSGLRVGGNALTQQSTWPKLSVFIDLAAIAADLGAPLAPRLLLLDPEPDSGYLREWTPVVMSPAKHRGYAFQWFSFAAAAIVIFVALHWRKRK